MSAVLDAATVALLAKAAQSGGGRHAYRATNEQVREQARALADASRADRRKVQQRERRALSAAQSAAREAMLAVFNGYAPDNVCARTQHVRMATIEYPTSRGYDSVTVPADDVDAEVADILAALEAVGMGAHADGVRVTMGDCCRFGALVHAWRDAPARKTMRDIARELFVDGTPREGWRNVVRAWRDSSRVTREVGAFALSRDDMRADKRSRFFRRTAYLLTTTEGLNAAADAQDVTQDAYLAALESRDGLTFGNMYRHVKASATSAGWRYARMGNRHSDNVRDWTWSDWEAWAASTGADALAYSSLEEWQAYDAAKLAHEADAAYRRHVTARREVEATYLDETRAAWVALLSQGMSVARICNLLGRTPETVATELATEGHSRLI